MTAGEEDRLWQRLDKWLWCARFMKLRAGCARWVAAGGVRINRQPTDKPHARVRPGDVLTLAHGTQVRVVRVTALAGRRGPPAEARTLFEEVAEPAGPAPDASSCTGDETAAYRPNSAAGLAS